MGGGHGGGGATRGIHRAPHPAHVDAGVARVSRRPAAVARTVQVGAIGIAPTVVIYMILSDRIVAAMTAGSLK